MGIDPVTAGLGASALSGLAGASSARKAAKAQQAAASQDIAFQKETRDIIRGDLSGYRDAGTNALAVLNYELGLGPLPSFGGRQLAVEEFQQPGGPAGGPAALGPHGVAQVRTGGRGGDGWPPAMTAAPGVTAYRVGDRTFADRAAADAYAQANSTAGTPYQGFTATPGYQFRFRQGTDAVNALAGARGGLVSGRTLQDLTSFGQGIAAEERGNYLARLGGLADTGLNAATLSGTASQNAASGVSNALAGIGNARAAGAIGVGNALQGGLGDAAGIYGYMQGYGPQQAASPYAPLASLRPRPRPL